MEAKRDLAELRRSLGTESKRVVSVDPELPEVVESGRGPKNEAQIKF